MDITSKTRNQLIAAAGVLVGLIGAIGIRGCVSHQRSSGGSPGTSSPTMNTNGPSVAEMVARHLNWAEQQSAAGLDPQLNALREFFAEARKGTRAFAEDALSFDSKWKFVVGYVKGNDDHRRYLADRLAARVLAPEQLELMLKYVVQAYLTYLNDLDAMVLVHLKADLANIPASSFSAGFDQSRIEQAMRTAIGDALRAFQAEFPRSIGQEIVSCIAGDALTVAGIELGTSAGILTAGAGSGTVTFGVGLVISLIVDRIISWAYEKYADPCGTLSDKLNETLTQLEEGIINGLDNEPGLKKRLLDYGARRSQARKTAIHSVVRP